MLSPGRIDISADRWVAMIRKIPIINADLTDAAFAMQVRLVADAPGAPLVDLTTQTTAAAEGVRVIEVATDTIANHIAAGRLLGVPSGYDAANSVTLSLIGIRINETTMEGMPWPAERGDNVVLVWDIHITPSGGVKQKYAGGTFTVRAGATQ